MFYPRNRHQHYTSGTITADDATMQVTSYLMDTNSSDIAFIRETIEGAAVTRLMARPNRSTVRHTLRSIAKQMERAISKRNWWLVAGSEMAFHRELVDAANSLRLSRMYAAVQAEPARYTHTLLDCCHGSKVLVEKHARLADLVAGEDLTAGLRELSQHLRSHAMIPRNANGDPSRL